MARAYTCTNYGGCTSAGVPQTGVGSGGTCPYCGGTLLAKGNARSTRGVVPLVKWGLVALLGLVALVVAWKMVPSTAQLFAPQYEILGRWRAEQTTLLDTALPVGPSLEFTNGSATVLQSQVPVTAYDRDGDRVHVVVPGGGGMEVSFTFRFEGQDKIVYEGPLGISMRYRRVKDAPQ